MATRATDFALLVYIQDLPRRHEKLRPAPFRSVQHSMASLHRNGSVSLAHRHPSVIINNAQALTKPNRTFGAYQTCDCMASVWAKKGGFIDFQTYAYYAAHGVYYYWGAATGLSLVVMSTGLVYIVEQYCTQSHISTENYHRAMQGLRFTRWFKKHTRFVSFVPDLMIRGGKILFFKLSGGRSRRGRRSLVWTAETRLYRLGNLGYRMNP